LLIPGVALQSGLDGGQLIGRDIPGKVFASLPTLEFVVGAAVAGTLPEGVGRKFATLHGRYGGDLQKDLLFGGSIHMCD
jgi:hypothetical protein